MYIDNEAAIRIVDRASLLTQLNYGSWIFVKVAVLCHTLKVFLVSLAFSESPFLGRKYKIDAGVKVRVRAHMDAWMSHTWEAIYWKRRDRERKRERERSNNAIMATTDYILTVTRSLCSVILYLVLTFHCIELISVHMPRKAKR